MKTIYWIQNSLLSLEEMNNLKLHLVLVIHLVMKKIKIFYLKFSNNMKMMKKFIFFKKF